MVAMCTAAIWAASMHSVSSFGWIALIAASMKFSPRSSGCLPCALALTIWAIKPSKKSASAVPRACITSARPNNGIGWSVEV